MQTQNNSGSHRKVLFPWTEFEEHLRSTGCAEFPMVGYGSLLSSLSATQTLSGADQREPVCVWGVKRIFNYSMPDRSRSRWNVKPGSNAVAALNVEVTGDQSDMFNGVLLSVRTEDIAALRLREQGYDLFEAPYSRWSSPESICGNAYVLSAPGSSVYVRHDIVPVQGYLNLCREAAYEYSQAFGLCFDNTTFLANGQTPLADCIGRDGDVGQR